MIDKFMKLTPVKLWEEEHPCFGRLEVNLFCLVESKLLFFTLESVDGLKLRLFLSENKKDSTLNLQTYHHHSFSEGDNLQWQMSFSNTETSFGPWSLSADTENGEIWKIPKIKEPLILLYNLNFQKLAYLDLSIINNSDQNFTDLEMLTTAFPKDANELFFYSGLSKSFFSLGVNNTKDKIYYSVCGSGILDVKILHKNTILLHRHIEIENNFFINNQYNQNVSVEVINHRGRIVKPKNGYYKVALQKDVKININPKGIIAEVKSIHINDPEISVSSRGKNNDREFLYNIKFHVNSHLTVKKIIHYTVEYNNREVRPHTIAFKLKSSKFALCIVGFLFILPTLVEFTLQMDFILENKFIYTYAVLALCVFIPLVYDRFRSI